MPRELRMAQEHQEYIQTKVNPTLENLVTQVLLERPDKPVPFMIRWLADQTKAPNTIFDGAEAEALRNEIKTLRAEIAELEAKLGDTDNRPPAAQEASGAAVGNENEDEENENNPYKEFSDEKEDLEEEEDDEDAPDELPPPAAYLQKGPRSSVSAEAYGEWNKAKAFTPPIHEKSEEQKQRIMAVLKNSILFQALDKADLDVIVLAMLETEVPDGQRIIQEGEDGEVMFVIERGSFECLKMIGGEEKVVKRCGPGDFFGELALLYNCPRAASVQSCEPSLLWQLDRETFNHIVRDASVKKRELHENFLKSVPILADLGSYELALLADALREEELPAETVVVRQGDEGDRFYLVERGDLVVQKSAGSEEPAKEVLDYGPGSYFGELALFSDNTKGVRAATVVTKSDCKLLYIDRRTFKSLLGSIEALLKSKAAEYA